MSGKLTYQSMIERVRIGLISQLWSDIQADREAIRAEVTKEVTASVTEELLKDHFKIGEYVMVNNGTKGNPNWVEGLVGANKMTDAAELYTDRPEWVRRPPETRHMTREEMIENIEYILGVTSEKSSKWTTDTLIEVLRSYRDNLEVPV